MGFPRIARQGKVAGDPPGPFDQSGRRLRIVVDFAQDQRRVEEWNGNTHAPLSMPNPEIFLWSLTEGESIDRYWIGTANDPADVGRVVIPSGPLDPNAHDYLGFSTINGQGRRTEYSIWPYSTYETFAQDDAGAPAGLSTEQWLAELLVARASTEMRADLMVTTNPRDLPRGFRTMEMINLRPRSRAADNCSGRRSGIGTRLPNAGVVDCRTPRCI